MQVIHQEHGAPMLARHATIELGERFEPDSKRRVSGAKNLTECVIDRYHQRMQIIDRQHAAGDRFRRLWRAASLGQSVVGSYGDSRGGGSGALGQSEARRDLKRVLVACRLAAEGGDQPVLVSTLDGARIEPMSLPIRLLDQGHVVVSVCGLDEWAGGSRRLEMLRAGLTSLADYWRLEATADTRG